jgi:signal transduction histidine kinase
MRARSTWIAFAVAFAVVLGVMAWVTTKLLELEGARADDERRAVLEEQVRLSLWRMDTAMTPIVAQELAETGPLAAASDEPPPPGVVMRFTVAPDGRLSPRTPDTGAQSVELEAALRGVDLAAIDARDGMRAGYEPPPAADRDRWEGEEQRYRNVVELNRRVENFNDNVSSYGSTISRTKLQGVKAGQGEDGRAGGEATGAPSFLRAAEIDAVTLDPSAVRTMWVGERLLVVRTIATAAGRRIDGSWLDWPVLRARLTDEIADLLPEAQLVPARDDELIERRLASVPVRLDPGQPPGGERSSWSPLRASVAVGWVFLLLASVMVAALLRVALALSERRATFVSAVTHELRTPLTTFRMYTEMLESDMVEPDKRARYLATMRRESERLGQLVENVLSYARIESDRARVQREGMSVAEVVARVEDRLRDRAAAAGLRLELALPDDVACARVEVDPAATEQILFNLVDNAAKYAPSSDEPRIALRGELAGARVRLHVRDFGPGVPREERAGIFAPFAKGTAHQAGTQPGVGLGLALARRLARAMGGELALGESDRGADFVLELPRAG